MPQVSSSFYIVMPIVITIVLLVMCSLPLLVNAANDRHSSRPRPDLAALVPPQAATEREPGRREADRPGSGRPDADREHRTAGGRDGGARARH